jgi:dienelactone hydrolase
VKPKIINERGFQANYFANKDVKNKAAIVLIGGGQWGNYWGVEFARKDFVGLSLPYTRLDGLPKLSEEIPLEYFEDALIWLREQPEVNPEKIVLMGASRNAELALVIASTLPDLVTGVVAYAPSSVSWSNTVLPFNSDSVKPSWIYKGEGIPYIPMEKISGNNTSTIRTLKYWEDGLNKKEYIEDASIKVEKINGPILLLSGKDDQVWPSARMADILESRLVEHNFKFQVENIQYENAGHLISGNPESDSDERTGKMTIQNKQYSFEYGGTKEGDYKAKQDAKIRVLRLIETL